MEFPRPSSGNTAVNELPCPSVLSADDRAAEQARQATTDGQSQARALVLTLQTRVDLPEGLE